MGQLDRLHQRAQEALQLRVGQLSGGLLRATGPERSQLVRGAYATAQAQLIAAGQQQAVRLAFAYMATLSPPLSPPAMSRALDGVLVTPESPRAGSGIVRLWALLEQGLPDDEAREQAGAYAAMLAEAGVASAEQGGLDEAADVGGRTATGWRKEPSPGACEWCQMIADGGARYHDASSVPRHDHDHCAVAPAFADET